MSRNYIQINLSFPKTFLLIKFKQSRVINLDPPHIKTCILFRSTNFVKRENDLLLEPGLHAFV